MIVNVMEEHVRAAYDRLKGTARDFIDTPAHREDVIVYALNRLPPKYVVSDQGKAVTGAALDAATLARYDANRNGVLDPSEQAAWDADTRRATSAVAPTSGEAPRSAEEVVSLSPFEVVSESRGYYGANTMSGRSSFSFTSL